MKSDHLLPLTSLRFFAALPIVILHIYGPILPGPMQQPLFLGVSFFFVLSGFILMHVYRDGVEPKRFYFARFARLWPVHIVTLCLMLALIPTGAGWRLDFIGPLIANVLMVHSWFPLLGFPSSFNSPSWSISAEAFFYLLFPILLSRHWRVCLIAMAVITAWALLVLEIDGQPMTHGEMWQFSRISLLLNHPLMHMLEFGVGTWAGRLFIERPRAWTVGHATLLEAASLLALAAYIAAKPEWYVVVDLGLKNVGVWMEHSSKMLLFAVIVFIFAHQRGAISRLLSWHPLVILGEISFATYMLHKVVILFAARHGWVAAIGTTPTVIAIFVITYAASWALWKGVEKPARLWLLGLWSRPRSLAGDLKMDVPVGAP
ncbi:acyltransferase family protein [Mangrovicella endophytica]|uniref:acyltransferase family protein n=1 Tax=Mangrovicella endophytica TaxID=2066697 RepID=UPI000C9E7F24|nr:acyltransferase [Mangrovicella endophytica]